MLTLSLLTFHFNPWKSYNSWKNGKKISVKGKKGWIRRVKDPSQREIKNLELHLPDWDFMGSQVDNSELFISSV